MRNLLHLREYHQGEELINFEFHLKMDRQNAFFIRIYDIRLKSPTLHKDFSWEVRIPLYEKTINHMPSMPQSCCLLRVTKPQDCKLYLAFD